MRDFEKICESPIVKIFCNERVYHVTYIINQWLIYYVSEINFKYIIYNNI